MLFAYVSPFLLSNPQLTPLTNLFLQNVELFFCLYANSWNRPERCNSSHSRLLGFFGALPPIWRALQCIRRYYDTKNVFPHLVNCGKYGMTILTAVCLSLYRISNTQTNMSLFITFATINAVYCSIWDLFMDFSLLQANARRKLLREITAIQPVSTYYLIMVVDPLLRFTWIFYAIFTHDTQHSTVVSFMVAFAEVFRRGIWALLRVENEHCGNVAQYKASRDTPLPYAIERDSSKRSGSLGEESGSSGVGGGDKGEEEGQGVGRQGGHVRRPSSVRFSSVVNTSGVDQASAGAPGSNRLRPVASGRTISEESTSQVKQGQGQETAAGVEQDVEGGQGGQGQGQGGGDGRGGVAGAFRRRYSETVGNKRSILQAMAEAHKQDFEKKRVPVDEDGGGSGGGGGVAGRLRSGSTRTGPGGGVADDDDDDEDEDVDLEGLRSDDDDDDDDSGCLEHERMHVREAERLVDRAREGGEFE